MANVPDIKEVYKLVTPIVDGEASETEKEFFFSAIENNPAVKEYYEEELWLKQLVKQKTHFHPAPEHLRKRVLQTIATMSSEGKMRSDPPRKERQPEKNTKMYFRASLGLAALLVLSLFIYLASIFSEDSSIMQADAANLPAVESHVYQFFIDHAGKFIPPDLEAGPQKNLHLEVSSMFQIEYAIPELENVVFAGVVQSELISEYQTPLFEYKVDEDDIIYIFAFHIPEMEKYLTRSDEAVTHCVRDTDYYIQHYKDRDIVSWKWDDNWYVGIADHDGETLVSLLPGDTKP